MWHRQIEEKSKDDSEALAQVGGCCCSTLKSPPKRRSLLLLLSNLLPDDVLSKVCSSVFQDYVATSEAENAVLGSACGVARPIKLAYVTPHLRNRQQPSEPRAPSNTTPLPSFNDRPSYSGPSSGSRWGSPRADSGHPGYGGGGGRGPEVEAEL